MSERHYGIQSNQFDSQMAYRCDPHAPWPLPAERRRARIRRLRLYLCAYALAGVGLFMVFGAQILEMLK